MVAVNLQPFVYRAACLEVVDGDTLTLRIDTGFHSTRVDRVRLLGVNAPELHKADSHAAGLQAKMFVQAQITAWQASQAEWPLLVQTHKSDSFGRWLAEVWPAEGDGPALSSLLLAAGHAVVFLPK